MKIRLLALLALILCACANQPQREPVPAAPPPAMGKGVLYEQLGGQAAIEKLVDVLVGEVSADKRINKLFAKTDIPYFKARLVEQLCQATGGPCVYTGLPMEQAHSGLKITNKEFDQFVEDLNRAMDIAGVGKPQQQQLIAILAPMRPQVVGQ